MIVFVDYPDGAGGEFLSKVIGMHDGWYNPSVIDESTMRANHNDPITSFLLLKRFENYSQWDIIAEESLIELKNKIGDLNVCIPYHSCAHRHNALLKHVFPNSIIITITPSSDHEWKLVNTEIIRKIYLDKLDFQGVQYIFKTFGFGQKKVNVKHFLKLDSFLIRNGKEITTANRIELLNQIRDFKISDWETSDYTINWGDLFLSISNINDEYYKLCNFLNIPPQDNILNHIVKRNQINLNHLLDYNIDNEIIKYCHSNDKP